MKIATSPLHVALIHSPTLEPSLRRKAGTEQAADPTGRAAGHLSNQTPGAASMLEPVSLLCSSGLHDRKFTAGYKNGMELLS